jgi:hypothetical protein
MRVHASPGDAAASEQHSDRALEFDLDIEHLPRLAPWQFVGLQTTPPIRVLICSAVSPGVYTVDPDAFLASPAFDEVSPEEQARLRAWCDELRLFSGGDARTALPRLRDCAAS